MCGEGRNVKFRKCYAQEFCIVLYCKTVCTIHLEFKICVFFRVTADLFDDIKTDTSIFILNISNFMFYNKLYVSNRLV